jgi:hypothetical protein
MFCIRHAATDQGKFQGKLQGKLIVLDGSMHRIAPMLELSRPETIFHYADLICEVGHALVSKREVLLRDAIVPSHD